MLYTVSMPAKTYLKVVGDEPQIFKGWLPAGVDVEIDWTRGDWGHISAPANYAGKFVSMMYLRVADTPPVEPPPVTPPERFIVYYKAGEIERFLPEKE